MTSTDRKLLAVPLLALLWGLNWPAVKIVLGEVAPWTLRTLGMGAGAAVLFAVLLARGRPPAVPRRHWGRLVLGGLLSVAGFNVLVAFAQLAGSTSRAAIVTFTMPVWAVLLAWPVLGERPDARRAAALSLGLAGLLLLAVPLLRAGELSRGVVFSLAAGLSWAAGTVFLKRWPIDAMPMVVAAWQLLVGAAAAAVGMLIFEGVPVPKMLTPRASLALAFHIVLASALAYYLWFEVVARLPAGVAALGTLLVPVVGVSGAMLLLGERPSGFDLAGFVLITGAAALALLPRGRRAPRIVAFTTDARFVRRARERRTVEAMVQMYCRRHHAGPAPCPDCAALLDYANRRLERCLFGDAKPTCANCVVHCYRAAERERIREIMRWAGPRMLLRHPVLGLLHLIDGRRPSPMLPGGIAANADGTRSDTSPHRPETTPTRGSRRRITAATTCRPPD